MAETDLPSDPDLSDPNALLSTPRQIEVTRNGRVYAWCEDLYCEDWNRVGGVHWHMVKDQDHG